MDAYLVARGEIDGRVLALLREPSLQHLGADKGCLTSRLATESAGSVALTYSVDSLDPLWAWAAPRFWWRGDINRLRQGTPGPDISSEQLEPVAGLPSWSNHPSGAGYAELSSESLWLVDGLGRYLGETPVS